MPDRTEAALAIAKVLRPGDVINTGWKMNWWNIWKIKKWLRYIASWRIQEYQKAYFGDRSIWDSTHTRIFLPHNKMRSIKEQCIFEVTTPVSHYVSLLDIALEDIRILRFTPRTLTPDDIFVMICAAAEIAGTDYDYGQLLDFLLHQLLNYPRNPFTLFDQGPEQKVCSTGVATLFHHLRKQLEIQIFIIEQEIKMKVVSGRDWQAEDLAIKKMKRELVPRLFNIAELRIWKDRDVVDNIDHCLNPDYDPDKNLYYTQIKTPIERVTPAHFENSDYFQNEFTEVARFKNGERYYHWPITPDVEATSTNKE